MDKPTNFRVTGRLQGLNPALLAELKDHAEEWELPLAESPGRLEIGLFGGLVIFTTEPEGEHLELLAETEPLLRSMQDAVSETLILHGAEIGWAEVAEGALAPNLALMRVESIEARTPGFLRVRISGPEAARFAVGGLHFRLLLPPLGRKTIWPKIGATGRLVWPEGEDAIHRPVYTTVEQEDDWLEFDVFRHERSPTCDWADRGPLGETVGIIGPGGGFLPEGDPLLLFGDETALPAIWRILRLAKVEVRAHLRASAADLGELAADPRVSAAPDLLEALKAAVPSKDAARGGHVWFAASAAEARLARAHLLGCGLAKGEFSAMAYWS